MYAYFDDLYKATAKSYQQLKVKSDQKQPDPHPVDKSPEVKQPNGKQPQKAAPTTANKQPPPKK
jgi:hypothetical protein